MLQAEIDAYDAIGIFTEKPPIEGTYDEALIAGVYGSDGKVVWPRPRSDRRHVRSCVRLGRRPQRCTTDCRASE